MVFSKVSTYIPNPPRFSFREEDGVRSARIRQPHNFRICDCGVSRSES